MPLKVYFSASSKVWEDISWVSGIADAGFAGWEIVADGNYRLDSRENVARIADAIGSLSLGITVHAPYGDLNLATLNYPIWRESVRQVCTCIAQASAWTDRVTIHPGYLSPVGKMLPGRAWEQQKEALREIGKVAEDHGVIACLENMIGIKEFLCRMPHELAGMVEGMPGIGTTIDIGHAHTNGQVGAFLPFLSTASHLHVHDNHGISDEHLPLGAGTIDWDFVGRAIARDYRGVVVVEGRSLAEGTESIRTVRGWRA